MNQVLTPINPDSTVNDVIRNYPVTIPVFNEFGIDSCCGGAASLRVAAERDGADLTALLGRLAIVIAKS